MTITLLNIRVICLQKTAVVLCKMHRFLRYIFWRGYHNAFFQIHFCRIQTSWIKQVINRWQGYGNTALFTRRKSTTATSWQLWNLSWSVKHAFIWTSNILNAQRKVQWEFLVQRTDWKLTLLLNTRLIEGLQFSYKELLIFTLLRSQMRW